MLKRFKVPKVLTTSRKPISSRCVAFFMAITDTKLKDSPEGSLRTRSPRESMDDSAGRSLEIDADERIGTATCGAWSSRVSVTRPPQSPCDAQTCHYHATLSTVGSTRTHNQRAESTYVNVRWVRRTIKLCDPTDHKEHASRAPDVEPRGCRLVDHLLVAVRGHTPVIVFFEVTWRWRRRILPSQESSIVHRSNDHWPRLVTQLCLPISLIRPRFRLLQAFYATRDPMNSTDWTVLMKRLVVTLA